MLILADTNIWCDFIRAGDQTLSSMMEHDLLAIHPLVIGELAVGNLPDRQQTLIDFHHLPTLRPALDHEVLTMVESRELYGRGLQWNDVIILASVIISPDTLLWTRDKRLEHAAMDLGVCYSA